MIRKKPHCFGINLIADKSETAYSVTVMVLHQNQRSARIK